MSKTTTSTKDKFHLKTKVEIVEIMIAQKSFSILLN